MDTNSRKVDSQPAIELNASLDSVNELRNVGVAGIEARICIHDSNDGA